MYDFLFAECYGLSVDIDKCQTSNPCNDTSTCMDTSGSYMCLCTSGLAYEYSTGVCQGKKSMSNFFVFTVSIDQGAIKSREVTQNAEVADDV